MYTCSLGDIISEGWPAKVKHTLMTIVWQLWNSRNTDSRRIVQHNYIALEKDAYDCLNHLRFIAGDLHHEQTRSKEP